MNKMRITLCGLALLLKGMSNLIRSWPLLAVALFFLSENVPHIRVVGAYYGYHYNPQCVFLGPRGFIYANHRPYGCPLLLMMNSKTGEVS
ncbi:MAG: hypothetical protein AAF569_00480 [Pseudomonadota bacterium]